MALVLSAIENLSSLVTVLITAAWPGQSGVPFEKPRTAWSSRRGWQADMKHMLLDEVAGYFMAGRLPVVFSVFALISRTLPSARPTIRVSLCKPRQVTVSFRSVNGALTKPS